MIDEAKRGRKSKEEKMKEFWKNYPVVFNPFDTKGTQVGYQNGLTGETRKDMSFSEEFNSVQDEYGAGTANLVKEIARLAINDFLLEETASSTNRLKGSDAEQKMLAYNMIALASMASLIASKILTDKGFAKRVKGSSSMFTSLLQRAINIVMTEPSVVQKIRYNVNNVRVFEGLDVANKNIPIPIYEHDFTFPNNFFDSLYEHLFEEHGAGEIGTDELVKKYIKDTPGEKEDKKDGCRKT